MLWAGVNHQDTAEDVASHFLNNSHQNQQGLAAAEPFSSAVICTDQALSWNESNKSLSAHQSSWSHCIHLHSSKLFPASSLFSFLKFGFKLLRGKMLPCCSPVTAGAGERWRAAARAAGPFKHSAWSNLLLPNSPAENRVRYFPWIQNDLPQQFSLLQEKASGRGGREGGKGKKKKTLLLWITRHFHNSPWSTTQGLCWREENENSCGGFGLHCSSVLPLALAHQCSLF